MKSANFAPVLKLRDGDFRLRFQPSRFSPSARAGARFPRATQNSANTRRAASVAHFHWKMPPFFVYSVVSIASTVEGERKALWLAQAGWTAG